MHRAEMNEGWGGRPDGPGRGRGRGRGGRRGGPFGGPGRGPGWGGGGWGGPGERPWRARRGDVRAAVLALVAERAMHGYEVIGEIEQRTDGAWRPSPGSVYPTLQMLEEEGLVTGEDVDGKRRFAITDAGTAEVESREGPPPWEEATRGAPASMVELRDALAATMPAIQQVFRVGTPAQQKATAEVLADTRRKVYEILAE